MQRLSLLRNCMFLYRTLINSTDVIYSLFQNKMIFLFFFMEERLRLSLFIGSQTFNLALEITIEC